MWIFGADFDVSCILALFHGRKARSYEDFGSATDVSDRVLVDEPVVSAPSVDDDSLDVEPAVPVDGGSISLSLCPSAGGPSVPEPSVTRSRSRRFGLMGR